MCKSCDSQSFDHEAQRVYEHLKRMEDGSAFNSRNKFDLRNQSKSRRP